MKEKTKRALGVIANAIGVAAALFAMLVAAWLFLAITPSQMSAECDALTEEIQGGGAINETTEHRASRQMADGRDRQEREDRPSEDGGRVHETDLVCREAVRPKGNNKE